MRIENVEALIERVGPLLDPQELTYFPGQAVWGIRLDEETSLLVDCDVEQNKLILSCEIGAPPPLDRSGLYELMLTYNFHWHATGGARLCVDGPEGNVGLLFDVALSGLEVTKLASILRNFAKVASDWRLIVHQPSLMADKGPSFPIDGSIIRI